MRLTGRIAEWVSCWSLRRRLFLLLIPPVVIMFVAMGLFSNSQALSIVMEKKIDLLRTLTEKMKADMTGMIDRAVRTTELVLYNTSIYESIFPSTSTTLTDQVKYLREAELYFSVLQEQFRFANIRVFTANSSLFYQNQNSRFFAMDRLEQLIPITTRVQSRLDQIVVVDTYERPNITGVPVKQLSIVRLLVEGPDFHVAGAVVIDIAPSTLFADWQFQYVGDYEMALVNREGSVLCSSKNENTGGQVTESLQDMLLSSDVFEQNGRFFVACQISRHGWTLYIDVPKEYLYEDTGSILTATLLMILVSCVFVGMTLGLTVLGITRKLSAFVRMIRESAGKETIQKVIRMRVTERAGSRDEVDLLLYAYNDLLKRIEVLTEENELSIRSESEARYVALQMQINPHFLHNTLASIKGYIEMNERAAAEQLVLQLSSLFSQTLGRGTTLIPLREELDAIKSYLKIQQMVYDDAFQFSIDMPVPLLHLIIPKFLLQPIVENALIHGACEADEPGRICISGRLEAEKALICVEDNGPGFKRSFLGAPTDDAQTGHGIGLQNVSLRMKQYFGDTAELCFENLPIGARAIMKIPCAYPAREEDMESV